MSSTRRVVYPLVLGLGMAGLFWAVFTGPFPLGEWCNRASGLWVQRFFEPPRRGFIGAEALLATVALAALGYLLAARLAVGLGGRLAAGLLLGVVPLGMLAVLLPAYPLLSGDIFKYVFDGRILAVYGQNPFLHVAAEFAGDPFLRQVDWKTNVNVHGPLWRLAEAGAVLVGGDDCTRAILAMKAWPALAYLGTTATLFALLRARQPERAIWGTMLYAWNPLVVLESLQNGHNDVLAALPALGAVWLGGCGRVRWAFPLLAVSVLVKPLAAALGPLLLLLAVRRGGPGLREAAIGMGLGGALVVLAYLPFWGGPATLQGLSREHIFSASPADLLLGWLREAGLTPARARPIASAVANGAFLAALVGLLRAAWLGRLGPVAAAAGVFFFYLMLAAQAFNPWYLLWLAPLAALAPDRPTRMLGVAFTLLAPLVYVLRFKSDAVVLAVFLPMALLAVWLTSRQVQARASSRHR